MIWFFMIIATCGIAYLAEAALKRVNTDIIQSSSELALQSKSQGQIFIYIACITILIAFLIRKAIFHPHKIFKGEPVTVERFTKYQVICIVSFALAESAALYGLITAQRGDVNITRLLYGAGLLAVICLKPLESDVPSTPGTKTVF